jgi:hypothetical protein
MYSNIVLVENSTAVVFAIFEMKTRPNSSTAVPQDIPFHVSFSD